MTFLIHILTGIAINLLLIPSYNLIFGKGKVLYFGYQGQALLSAYMVFVPYMLFDLSFPMSFAIGVAGTIVVSLVFSVISLRLDDDAFGVMSIAMHLSILAVVLNAQSLTRGALGIPRIPKPVFADDPVSFCLLSVSVAVFWLMGVWWLDRGAFGRKLSALSAHPWHAAALGISRPFVHHVSFLVASIGSLISVTLFSMHLHILNASDYTFVFMVFYVMVVVASGPGKFWGSVFGTAALILLKEGLRFAPLPHSVLGPVRLLLFGLILFIAVWYRRDTLFPKQRSI